MLWPMLFTSVGSGTVLHTHRPELGAWHATGVSWDACYVADNGASLVSALALVFSFI